MTMNNDTDLKRSKMICDTIVCAFFCCRYGNHQDLSDRIDDLVRIGMTVAEIEEATIISRRPTNHSLFTTRDLLFATAEEQHVTDFHFTCKFGEVVNPIYWEEGSHGLYTDINGKEGIYVLTCVHRTDISQETRDGQFKCVHVLEQKGFDMMKRNRWDQNLPHRTLRKEVVQHYIENHDVGVNECIDYDDETNATWTMLRSTMYQIDQYSIECAKYLIENGADIHHNDMCDFPETMIGTLFDECFQFTPMHLDFFRYLVANGIKLKTLNILNVLACARTCTGSKIDTAEQKEVFRDIFKIMEENGCNVFMKDTDGCPRVFDNTDFIYTTTDEFKIVWDLYMNGTNRSQAKQQVQNTIFMLSDQVQINCILDSYVEKFADRAREEERAGRSALLTKGLPVEIVDKILDSMYVPGEVPFMMEIEDSITMRDRNLYYNWLHILFRSCLTEREKTVTAKYLMKLLSNELALMKSDETGDTLEQERILVDMVANIASIQPSVVSGEHRAFIWTKCIPSTIRTQELCSFSMFIDAVSQQCRQFHRTQGSSRLKHIHEDPPKKLRALIKKYQTPLSSNSTKAERRAHTRILDKFFGKVKHAVFMEE